jgi:hypothetical protein
MMTDNTPDDGSSIVRRILVPVVWLLALLAFGYVTVSWLQVGVRRNLKTTTGVAIQDRLIAIRPTWLYPVILILIVLGTIFFILYQVVARLPSHGSWRDLVRVQANFIEHQLDILCAYKRIRRRPTDIEPDIICEATRAHLREARRAADPSRAVDPKRSRGWTDQLIDVWTGASTEAAFRNLHAASVTMVPLLPEEDIEARIPEALARLKGCPATDPRRRAAEQHLRRGIPKARLWAEYASALELGYEIKDDEHVRVREFRNVLLSATAALTAVVAAFCIVGASFPDAVPLCFAPPSTTSPQQETAPVAQPTTAPTTDDDPEPDQTTTEPATTTRPPTDDDREPDQTTTTKEVQKDTVCPSEEQPPGPRGKGRRLPAPGDVTLVALFGLLGGALSGAFSIRKMHDQSTPYGVPVTLALLKLPAGALTAILGILLVRGAFVPGLSQLDTQPQILAYAFFFGIAQQVVTRLVDERAREVLGRVPTKTTPQDRAKEAASEPAELQATATGKTRRWLRQGVRRVRR